MPREWRRCPASRSRSSPRGPIPGVIHAAYAANPALGASSATADLTVTPPAVAIDDVYTTNEDSPLSVPAPGVLANDFRCGAGPPLRSLNRSTGRWSSAPARLLRLRARGQLFGSDMFTYKVAVGGVDSGVATVTLTVRRTSTNHPLPYELSAATPPAWRP